MVKSSWSSPQGTLEAGRGFIRKILPRPFKRTVQIRSTPVKTMPKTPKLRKLGTRCLHRTMAQRCMHTSLCAARFRTMVCSGDWGSPRLRLGFRVRLNRPGTQDVTRFVMVFDPIEGGFMYMLWGYIFFQGGINTLPSGLRPGSMGNGVRSGLRLCFPAR